jgi:hypothetical protein
MGTKLDGGERDFGETIFGNTLALDSENLPIENNCHSRGHTEDQKKNRQFLGNGVPGSHDADPHIGTGDSEPECDKNDSCHNCGTRVVCGKELAQQERPRHEQKTCEEEESSAHALSFCIGGKTNSPLAVGVAGPLY